MKPNETKLTKGIFVTIDDDNLFRLQTEHTGYLSREAYPEHYEDIAVPDEVGRFLIFRILNKE